MYLQKAPSIILLLIFHRTGVFIFQIWFIGHWFVHLFFPKLLTHYYCVIQYFTLRFNETLELIFSNILFRG